MKRIGVVMELKKIAVCVWLLAALSAPARADVSIEAAASTSRVEVGDQLTLDIIISDAEGKIEAPKIGSLDGFTAYSQGHSQEMSIINGVSSSRSIFSYTLLANSVGKKVIGPIEVTIGGKIFKVAPVEVSVVAAGASGSGFSQAQTSGPVSPPPSRALPSGDVSDRDIFVRAWLDKDEVFVNEPVMLTYTLYTRLPATYKGFEKEAVTTGFWVEDFPPESTIKRTEKIINGSRFVVADVRKLALFPTQAGIFTLDPGTISATVEVQDGDPFDSFFSSNIFGRRSFPSSMMSQIVAKEILIDPLSINVQALPETDKPAGFDGAVGNYLMEGSIDKHEVQAGDPVTYRIRIWGQGNINTLSMPKIPPMPDFKIYDASSSIQLSKEKLIVEGEKVSETVIVPKKAGKYVIAPVVFSYFDIRDKTYRVMKTDPQTLIVTESSEAPAPEEDPSSGPSPAGVIPAEKENISLEAKDIRYIKTVDSPKAFSGLNLHEKPLFWVTNLLLLLGLGALSWISGRQGSVFDLRGMRFRRSHAVAKKKLRAASKLLKEEKQDEFYAEVGRAVYSYFADKLNVSAQTVSASLIEKHGGMDLTAELVNRIQKLFDELSSGRFSKSAKSKEDMKYLYDLADEIITQFEKVKIQS